jgi:hypothetical protein
MYQDQVDVHSHCTTHNILPPLRKKKDTILALISQTCKHLTNRYYKIIFYNKCNATYLLNPICLNLSAESICYSTLFFHNKSTKNTFCYGFSANL